MNATYEGFIHKANELWDDFTTGNKNKKVAEAKPLTKQPTMV
jgi:hypothetical protein